MVSVASQLIEGVNAHAQSDSLEDAREVCADGTYFPNNLRTTYQPETPPLSRAVLKDAKFPTGQTVVFGSAIKETPTSTITA